MFITCLRFSLTRHANDSSATAMKLEYFPRSPCCYLYLKNYVYKSCRLFNNIGRNHTEFQDTNYFSVVIVKLNVAIYQFVGMPSVFLEELVVIHLQRKFPAFLEPECHRCTHKRLPLDPIINYSVHCSEAFATRV